jgi:hypothetical protein
MGEPSRPRRRPTATRGRAAKGWGW